MGEFPILRCSPEKIALSVSGPTVTVPLSPPLWAALPKGGLNREGGPKSADVSREGPRRGLVMHFYAGSCLFHGCEQ